MYCSNCGNKVSIDSKFCEHCGNLLKNENSDAHFNNVSAVKSNFSKNPWDLYLDTWKNLFDFKSATSRRGFWWPYLFHVITILIAGILFGYYSFLTFAILTVIYIPMLSSGVRRMKDADKPVIIAYLTIIIPWITNEFLVGYYINKIGSFVSIVPATLFVIFACFPTQRNKK